MYLCIDNVYNETKVVKGIDEAVFTLNKMILGKSGSAQEKIDYITSLYEQQEDSRLICLFDDYNNTLAYQILPLSDSIIKTIKEI